VYLVAFDAPFGAEVVGVDTGHIDTGTGATLRAALAQHRLLLFRGQIVSGPDQVRLCAHFGPIASESAGGFGYVSNRHPEGFLREGALPFHSDLAFTLDPVRALSLHALEVPRVGAPTVFADAVGVVDRMPVALRDRLHRHRVANTFDFSAPNDLRMLGHEPPLSSPVVEVVALGRHPVSGAPMVQASELHTQVVVGLAPGESAALLDELFGHLYAPENTYRHDWRVGDLVVWDNLALQHHRPAFPTAEARTMQRVCIHHKTLRDLVPNLGELLSGGGYAY
jgi:alpha-ketoglutarate-dependent taurine dioxygenase